LNNYTHCIYIATNSIYTHTHIHTMFVTAYLDFYSGISLRWSGLFNKRMVPQKRISGINTAGFQTPDALPVTKPISQNTVGNIQR